jgi:predicted cation transporter
MLRLAFGIVVMFVVLLGPIFLEVVEQNVETFFLLIGLMTCVLMGQFKAAVIWGALSEPLPFTLAVLVFGGAFRLLRDYFDLGVQRINAIVDARIFCFCLATFLGFLGAFITPVVSALVFVEAVSLLHCDRRSEIAATVFACFAIGFGSGLTPLGMPGIAVVLRSLHADFWYLTRLLGLYIGVGVILTAIPVLFLSFTSSETFDLPIERESWRLVLLIRPSRVYVFIAGLVALSDGLRPLVDAYIQRVPSGLLFWLNTISAVVNNSTLAAVEIGPSLSRNQQRSALLGLLVSGGMLVTGNIPNVVAASRLGITSREWARIGTGVGLLLLILFFVLLSITAFAC